MEPKTIKFGSSGESLISMWRYFILVSVTFSISSVANDEMTGSEACFENILP